MQLEPESNELPQPELHTGSTHRPGAMMPPPRQRYRAGARWLLLSGAIAVLGIGGWLAYQRWGQPAPTVATVSLLPVQRGTVEQTISESGTVALDGEQTLKSPEDCTVEQVFVRPGDRVKAGAPLIVLRNREDQQRLQNQLIDNQKAELDLSRKQEVVRERKSRLQTAIQRLKEAQELLRQGFIAEIDVQSDREKVDTAQSELRDAEIEQQKAALEVQKGRTALRDIQQRLGDNRLNSPMDALILGVDVKPGDGAKRETNLLTLGDPTRETVDLQLTTLNAARVRINQVARVSMIGPNAKTFTGRVLSLSPQAAARKSEDGSGGGQSQAKVNATVALDRPTQVLIPGSQVSVEIILKQRRQVVTLPLDAIQQLEQDPYVWVRNRAGQAEPRSVKLGLQSLTTVEVLSGLQVGEKVAVPAPNQTLTPGTPLQTAPTPPDLPLATP